MYADQYFFSMTLPLTEFKFAPLPEDWYKFHVTDVSAFFTMKVKQVLTLMTVT